MNWIEPLLIAAAVLGICAGGVLVARSPAFWIGMAKVILTNAWPYLVRWLKPASPEELKRLDEGPGRSGDFKNTKGSARPFDRGKGE